MKILLLYRWSPYTTAAYFAKAFREMGHDVRSDGPVAAHSVPEYQWHYLGPGHWSHGWDGWRYDLIVWIEAGGGWCPQMYEIDERSIGYFIDSHSRITDHIEQAGSDGILDSSAKLMMIPQYTPSVDGFSDSWRNDTI